MKKQDWLTAFVHELQRLRADIPRRDAHRAGMALYGDGGAAPASVAKVFVAEWEGWVAAFVAELQRLRPTINAQLCRTIAIVWYANGSYRDPAEAARRYVNTQRG